SKSRRLQVRGSYQRLMRSPPTARSESGTTLLVLAHQDDEIAFAPLIIRLTDEGRMVNLVYLTDGGGRGVRAARRDAESRNALATLGVAPKSVWFLGSDAGIADGALYHSMEMAY